MHLPPLYYILGAVAYRLVYRSDILTRLYAVRQVSVILALITVWLAYLTTRLVFPANSMLHVTIPTLVSFHPMFTFLGAVVSTDIMLITLSSWTIYLVLVIAYSGFTVGRSIQLGLAFGLGMLTKPQIWFLLTPFTLVILHEIYHRRISIQRLLILVTLIIIICLTVSGWSLIRNQMLNKNIFYSPRQSRFDPHPNTTLTEFLWAYEDRLADSLLRGYWGMFGWLDTYMPQWSYYCLRLTTCMALLGIAIYIGKLGIEKLFTGANFLLTTHGVNAITINIAFAILGFWHYRNAGGTQPSQGRYFLAPLVSQMTLWTIGLLSFVPDRWHRVGHLALQTGMILLNIVALFGALIPRYYVP